METQILEQIAISDRALSEISSKLIESGLNNPGLMIYVGMACSGPQYAIGLKNMSDVGESEEVYKIGDLNIIIEKESAKYVEGVKIDYIDTEQAKGFTVQNPRYSCGGCTGC